MGLPSGRLESAFPSPASHATGSSAPIIVMPTGNSSRSLRPDLTLVASDRMARIDVKPIPDRGGPGASRGKAIG